MRKLSIAFVVLGLVSLPVAAFIYLVPTLACPAYLFNERNATATLKSLASAEADFLENDRDGDGRREYWRRDVGGLYILVPAGSTEAIKLIESSAASADLADPAGFPKAGYRFAALPFEDELDAAPRADRFAFCAVPVSPAAGRFTYAVTQEGVVWRLPARGLPLFMPLDPARAKWTPY